MTGADDHRDERRRVQSAKSDLKAMERQANLPPSGSADFVKLIGVLCILAAVFVAGESMIAAIGYAIIGAFIIASGFLQQAIFDVRSLLLRNALNAHGNLPITEAGALDA